MVSTLAASERTAIAVARALADTGNPVPLLVLDEPTASLPGPEVDRLFAALRRVAESGTSILFISHHLDEVLGLCHRVTVLRATAAWSPPSARTSCRTARWSS